MKTLKATGSTIVVLPDRGEVDADGRPISSGGLYLGREINYPTGEVCSIGPTAAKLLPELRLGAKVVYQRVLLSKLTLDGVDLEVIDVAEDCPRCKNRISKSSIIGIVEGASKGAEVIL